MRRVYTFFVLASGLTFATAGDWLIPFDDLHFSVDTNWRAGKGGEGEALRVDVSVSRSAGNPDGSIRTEIRCSGFESEEQNFSESDLETLFEAFEAAEKGEVYEKEVLSPTLRGRVKTRFKAATAGTKPIVRVSRGKTEVYFTRDERNNTKEALALARAAEAWYRKLLNATTLPAITPAAHPPPAQGLYLSSTVGEVPGAGFAFEVRVRSWGWRYSEYQVEQGLRGPMWSSAGSWVNDLIGTVSQAIEAGKSGAPFKHQFDSGRHRNADAIFITANPATGHAEVMIKFGEGLLSNQPVAFGTFGEKELKAIRELEEVAKLRRKWFADHESLFLVPPPKEP